MLQAMSTAATGMQAQETQIQVISNNLANASTPGFKVSRAHFQDLLYVNERQAGTQSSQTSFVPTGSSIGLGAKTASVDQVFTEGELDNTGNPLDVAIQGNGFFQVSMPDGSISYTRDGSFRLDQNGKLVDPRRLRRDARHQRAAGRAQSDYRSRWNRFGAGREIRPCRARSGSFRSSISSIPSGLQPLGQNLYSQTQASGPPQTGIAGQNGFGSVAQGFLEMPNESTVQELVGLISAQRAYEASSKAVQVADQMQNTANGLIQ